MLNWLKQLTSKWHSSAVAPAPSAEAPPSQAASSKLVGADRALELIRHGNQFLDQGAIERAASAYRAAIESDPHCVAGYVNLGFVLRSLGQLQDAADQLQRALALDSCQIDALFLLGLKAQSEGDASRAASLLLRCHQSQPNFEAVVGPLCAVLMQLGQHQKADSVVRAALSFHPDSSELKCEMAAIQAGMGDHLAALAIYDHLVTADPSHARAWSERGLTLSAVRRHDAAIESARSALRLDPSAAGAYVNLGVVYSALKLYQAALAQFDESLLRQPGFPIALYSRGQVLTAMHRYEEAADAFRQVLVNDPLHREALGGLLWSNRCVCNWDGHEQILAQVNAAVQAGQPCMEPWAFLAVSDSASLQLQCARRYAASVATSPAAPLWRRRPYTHGKIRVAYLSADFHEHATSYLMAELFERHDRSRFSTFAFSFGPASDGPMRRRLVGCFEDFLDVREKNDIEVARMICDLEIDIAVDLKGYTRDARPAILAHRPAPIQVNYLGYPGSMGAEHIDYVIADKWVAPHDADAHYSEKIVRLPNCYQVNDSKRRISAERFTRARCGLPESAFVFCCFNNSYKINPQVFQVWMNLLRRLEGSVIWLLDDNPAAIKNLKQVAARHGVSAERLVFAPRIAMEEHLARHQLADLALDTLPCNAHTTASDALWAGLPLLTCSGSAFASRVASSLLHALDLPELITANLSAYEEEALRLATDPARLQGIKSRLAANRTTSPLFDSALFAGKIEAAYESMWQKSRQNLEPARIDIA